MSLLLVLRCLGSLLRTLQSFDTLPLAPSEGAARCLPGPSEDVHQVLAIKFRTRRALIKLDGLRCPCLEEATEAEKAAKAARAAVPYYVLRSSVSGGFCVQA